MSAADQSARKLADQAAANLRHPLSLTLLTLTFSTGTVDAVSYLGLGHVFTANMTGNIVLLGFGIAGAGGLPVVSPLVSLAAFMVGAGAGGALARRVQNRHPAQLVYALALEAGLLAGATAVAAATHPHRGTATADATIALMAAAMGIRNAIVRRIAVPDLDHHRAHDDHHRSGRGLDHRRRLWEGHGETHLGDPGDARRRNLRRPVTQNQHDAGARLSSCPGARQLRRLRFGPWSSSRSRR